MFLLNKRSLGILIALFMLVTLNVACGGTPTPAAPSGGASAGTPGAQSKPPAGAPGARPEAAQPTATPRPVAKARLVGNLVSANQSGLSFAVAGRVVEIKAPEGAQVKAGDLIASLDTKTLEIQVAQAQAALDLANANWNRVKAGPTADDVLIARASIERAQAAVIQAQSAYDRIGGDSNPFIATTTQALTLQQAIATYQGAVAQLNVALNRPTQSERDTNLAQIAAAQAALDVAQRNLNNARVVAPFAGTVIAITPKVGESVAANTSVITLADLTKMQVLVNADETTLTTLKVGQAASITLDALGGKTVNGRVKKIGMLATTASGIVSVPVWIDVETSDAVIYPGLSATVEIVTGS